jgi:hypothetical protein
VAVSAVTWAGHVPAGSVATLSATVRSVVRRSVVLDLEVYDAAGARVLQRFRSPSLSAGQAVTLSTSWRTPGTAGVYRVAVGAFGPR